MKTKPSALLLVLVLGSAPAAPAAGAASAAAPAIAIARLEAAGAAGAAKARVTLSPDVAPSWGEANVGILAVRGAALQTRLEPSLAGTEIEVPLPAAGCALLYGDLGRPEGRGFPDSWRRTQRSVKAVLCRDGGDPAEDLAARRRSASLLMARAGTRDEIRPLANPATTRPGSDLPVRVYADGREAAGIEVVAEGPGGILSVTRTDAHGFAVVALPAAGAWRLGFRAGPERAAELHFEVPPASLHEARR